MDKIAGHCRIARCSFGCIGALVAREHLQRHNSGNDVRGGAAVASGSSRNLAILREEHEAVDPRLRGGEVE